MEDLDLGAILDTVRGKPVVLMPFRDRSKSRALLLFSGETFEFVLDPAVSFVDEVIREASHVVCFGHRHVESYLSLPKIIYDVKLLYGGEEKLSTIVGQHLDPMMAADVLDRERKFEAHVRASKTAEVDLQRHSLLRLVPPRVVQSLLKMRAIVTMDLFSRALRGETADLGAYERDLWPMAQALRSVEQSGVRVDVDFAKHQVRQNLPKHEMTFFQHIVQHDAPYVWTEYNPVGGKTGRIKVASGFNTLGIPHGPVRKAIVSRYVDGEIMNFDYNAIDYRSIVASVNDPDFRALYADAEDFHSRTCELVLQGEPNPLRRDIIKYFSYVCIYGGSDETLHQKTRLSMEKVQQVKEMMERKLRPVIEFRHQLAIQARRDGFVLLPNGKRITVSSEDHDGKILGLYAQGFSSLVFDRALVEVQRYMQDKKSKTLFTVHDSIVIDHHLDEGVLPTVVQETMERALPGYRFRVNVKRGRTYADATQ